MIDSYYFEKRMTQTFFFFLRKTERCRKREKGALSPVKWIVLRCKEYIEGAIQYARWRNRFHSIQLPHHMSTGMSEQERSLRNTRFEDKESHVAVRVRRKETEKKKEKTEARSINLRRLELPLYLNQDPLKGKRTSRVRWGFLGGSLPSDIADSPSSLKMGL